MMDLLLLILKGKKLPVGHVSTRKDGSKWRKEKEGKWTKVASGKSRSQTKKPNDTIPLDKGKEIEPTESKAISLPFEIPDPATGTKYSKDEIQKIRFMVSDYFQPYSDSFGYRKEYDHTIEMTERTKALRNGQYLPFRPNGVWDDLKMFIFPSSRYDRATNSFINDRGIYRFAGHKKLTKSDVTQRILEIKTEYDNHLKEAISRCERFFSFSQPEQAVREKFFGDDNDAAKYLKLTFDIDFPRVSQDISAQSTKGRESLAEGFTKLFDSIKLKGIENEVDEDIRERIDRITDTKSYYRQEQIRDLSFALVRKKGVPFSKILPIFEKSEDLVEKVKREQQKASFQEEIDRFLKIGDALYEKEYKSIGAINKKLSDLGHGYFKYEPKSYGPPGFRYEPRSRVEVTSYRFHYTFPEDHATRSDMDNLRISAATIAYNLKKNIEGRDDKYAYSTEFKEKPFSTVEQAKAFYRSLCNKNDPIAVITKKTKRKK